MLSFDISNKVNCYKFRLLPNRSFHTLYLSESLPLSLSRIPSRHLLGMAASQGKKEMRCRSSIPCPTPITSSPASLYCTLLKLFMFKDVIITCSCFARKFHNQLWISGFIDVGGLASNFIDTCPPVFPHVKAVDRRVTLSFFHLQSSPKLSGDHELPNWSPVRTLCSITCAVGEHHYIQWPNPIHINCVVSVNQPARIKLLSQKLLKCCVGEEWK